MVSARWLQRALLGVGLLGCLVGSGVAQDNQRSPWTVRLDFMCTESPKGTERPMWNQTKEVAPWSGRSDMGAVVSDSGTLFVYGGQGGGGADSTLLRDVWSTSNGEDWTMVSTAAQWTARKSFGAVSFNKKIWAVGGLSAAGASNAVYSSLDGLSWSEVRAETPHCTAACSPGADDYIWSPRHSMVVLGYVGKLWVIGGVSSGLSEEAAADAAFNHDVWSSTDGVGWSRVNAETPWERRRGVVGVVYSLVMYVLAESGDYRSYYNLWSSRDGVTWSEPMTGCTVSGQRLGGINVYSTGLLLFSVADEWAGDQSVRMWQSSNLGSVFDGTFSRLPGVVGDKPLRGARYVVFKSQIFQLGGACQRCVTLKGDDKFSTVWHSWGPVGLSFSPASRALPSFGATLLVSLASVLLGSVVAQKSFL